MKVVLLAGKGDSTKYVYNGIINDVQIEAVLISDSISKKKLIQRRIKKLGLITVLNQLFFQLFIKIIRFSLKNKILTKKNELGLNDQPIPESKLINVGYVNSIKCITTLISINPDVIIVNGTSIISKKVLECTNAIFINTHVGITPQYRGVHGGYWALRNKDCDNFGVTIHKVDAGIDTGDIIYQETCQVSKQDNFLIYPLYQYAMAIPLLKKTISDIKNKKIHTFKKENQVSRLYYHPTFTSYIYGWLTEDVK